MAGVLLCGAVDKSAGGADFPGRQYIKNGAGKMKESSFRRRFSVRFSEHDRSLKVPLFFQNMNSEDFFESKNASISSKLVNNVLNILKTYKFFPHYLFGYCAFTGIVHKIKRVRLFVSF
jgi:hypothetical protein